MPAVSGRRSNRAKTAPSRKIAAIRTFSLTATASRISVAPFASPNDTAAVLLVPTTSASMPMSRVRPARAVVVSYADQRKAREQRGPCW